MDRERLGRPCSEVVKGILKFFGSVQGSYIRDSNKNNFR